MQGSRSRQEGVPTRIAMHKEAAWRSTHNARSHPCPNKPRSRTTHQASISHSHPTPSAPAITNALLHGRVRKSQSSTHGELPYNEHL